jgi:hypothetical protein
MLCVAMIDKDRGRDAGGLTRGDILPAVTDEVRRGQCDRVFAGGTQKKTGRRFPAITPIRVIVRADVEAVERKLARERVPRATSG